MAVLVSPGVLTREIDLSLYVPALSTTILGIVATTTKGPINSPELITTVAQLEKTYGESNPNHPGILTAQLYLKYGRQCRFVRVANPSTLFAAGTDIASASDSSAVLSGTLAGPFTFTASSPGTVTGTEVGPYTIGSGSSDTLLLAADSGPGQTVTLTAGTRTAQQIVDEINAQTTGLTASIVSGKIRIVSNTLGDSSAVDVSSVANNAYTVLGLTPGSYDGASGTDTLDIEVDGGASQPVQFTAGLLTSTQVAAAIQSAVSGITATVVGNKVVLTTASTGSSASVQVMNTSTADSVIGFSNTVANGTDAGATSVSFTAISPGTWGNRLQIRVTDSVSVAGTKNIVVLYKGVPVENWRNLSKNPNSTIGGVSNYFADVINGKSEFITVQDNTGNNAYPVNGTADLSGGEDGLSGLSDGHFIGTITNGVATGLQLFADSRTMDLNLVAAPGQTSMAVHSAMISLCEVRGDSMCLCDPPLGLTPTQVFDFKNGLGAYSSTRVALDSSYAAMYYPWIKAYDPANQLIVDIPPSAAAIRTYIYNDTVGEVWFAPMGVNRGRISEAVGIERTLTQGECDFLYENNISPIENIPRYGVTIFGQKTLQTAPTALDRVNVRRLLLYLRKVIATAVFPMVGEPNTPRLWRRFVDLVTPTLSYVKDREGLNAFRVLCDSTTNTPDVIDRSEFRARIGLKPTKAAEFVIIDFVIVNQSSLFQELSSATF